MPEEVTKYKLFLEKNQSDSANHDCNTKMAMRTLPSEERYSLNKSKGGGGTKHRRKLKKLKSVKVANLDRQRSSMKKEKTRFVPGSSESESSSSLMMRRERTRFIPSSSESESSSSLMMRRERTRFIPSSSESESSSSSPMPGTYSPNYMRATTSSSARKASSSRTPERRISPSSRGKLSSKLSEVSVEQCSKNYQFADVEIGEFEDNVNAYYDQDGMIKVKPKQKGLLERSLSRSRSIRMMRLKSLRSSRRHKSRLSGETTAQNHSGVGNPYAAPQDMKATSTRESRKDYVKGITRTSNLRPLRILAKIPSLRPSRSKVRKQSGLGPLLGVNIHRATCSSVLKSSKFSDHIQVNSGGLESERFSSLHVCPYNYCSLHGHQHHAPSPPLKEFVSAKRLLGKYQKSRQLENQLKGKVKHSKSVKEINHLKQTVDTERPAAKEVVNTRISSYQGEKYSDKDFLVNVYAKPRKNWETESSPREDAEALSNLDCTDNNLGGYKWKLEDVHGGTTPPQAREEALTEGRMEFTKRNIKSSNKTQQQTIKFEVSDSSVKLPDSGLKSSLVDKTLIPLIVEAETQSFVKNHSHSLSTNSESCSATLTNILSDKQKYSSIWHLIYQQFKPSEEMISKDQGNRGIGEREQGGSSLHKEEDNQGAPMEKTNFDQTDAINLVQEALNAILECGAIPDQEMHHSPPGEEMEQVGEAKPGQKVSNWSKLKKIIVTAKFIKAISNLIKKSPGKPQLLLPALTSGEDKVYLRHLSMNERKYEEEWMLDFALRKVLSRLAPDQQRRVGLLVEAFETFGPENTEKNNKFYPEKQETAPGIELVTSVNEEPKQLIESKQAVFVSEEQVPKKQDNGVPVNLKGAPQEINLREDNWYGASATAGKTLQEADVTSIFSESPRNSSTTSTDRGFEDLGMQSKEKRKILKVGPQFQTGDLAVYPSGDMVMVLFDKQKYSSMWNMIYQHVVSSEVSTEVKQRANGLDEKDEGLNVNTCDDDLDSTPSSYSTDHEQDEDNHSVSGEKKELSKSAAVKLVKEAVNAILQSHELSPNKQSTKDHRNAFDNVKELVIPIKTNSNEENFREGSNTHPEAKVLEKTSDASQKQVEVNESNAPHKRMSKGHSKLRKAIVTAKFIKAMEKLRKINSQKPRQLVPEAASEKEKVNLRHLSMDGRKHGEEWMLDYALRKVITRLDPDQQRRVALLVEAFETLTPEQKEKGIRLANQTSKESKQTSKESKQFVGSEQQRTVLDEQGLRKQDDGFLTSSEGIPKEVHDNQATAVGEKSRQETGKTAVSSSTSESTENGSKTVCVNVTSEEVSTVNEEMRTTREVASHSPTGDSDIGTAGKLTSILSDKTKYNSMWNLIYQHVVPRKASRAEEDADNEIDEDKHCEDANNGQQMNDLELTVRSDNIKEDETNKSAACKEHELDQSTAIKLVHEAISTILQCSEPDDRLQEEVNENAPTQRDRPKSLSKLRKLFVTVKFMKAMERMRRISPRKPLYLSHEATLEEEKVCLRHQDINARRNAEEWMLDYALRNVISNLAPEQQRRVVLLVEAFQTVTPEQKGSTNRSYIKAGVSPATELASNPSVKQTTRPEYDAHIHPNAADRTTLLGKVIRLERSPREDYPMDISNFKTKLHEEILDSSLEVKDPINALRERKERNSNSKSEPIPEASLSKDSEQDCEANITRGIFYDTQKHTRMWPLIYQRTKSVTAIEAGSSPSEIVDQLESGSRSSEMIDDSDTSSVTSELGETDAVKLVREAINDILAVPRELDNGLLSSNTVGASDESQRAGREEKTLSRGFSKLRKIILCNKFIKAMEKAKMRKSDPQKRKNLILNSNPETEQTIILKRCAVGETKNTGELMLDRALQKVIEELAPVQQRRVALLVEAFEKVNPDIEEIGKRFSNTGTVSLSPTSHTKGNINRSQVPNDVDLTLQGSVTASSREVAADSALEEIHRGDTAPSRTENLLEDEGNPSVENYIAVDKVRHSSLWRLLVQHVNSDILDESETQKTGNFDTSGGANCAHEFLGKNTDYSAEVKHNEDVNVQMPRSMSFEIQEKEAIKVVQEALDEILTCDDQPMTTTTTLDQDSCIENHGVRGEPSPSTEEIEEVQTSVDSVAKPKEEQELAKEKLSNIYSQLCKVNLCKIFIKAMDKMRKLKAQSPQDQTQKLQLEDKIVRPMRQTASNHGKNWEEWMLDRAMQKVVGELAPVQKKKVSLLVQAFEKVSSQPEPRNDKKGQAVGL